MKKALLCRQGSPKKQCNLIIDYKPIESYCPDLIPENKTRIIVWVWDCRIQKARKHKLAWFLSSTIKSMVDTFGGQSVVASLDVKKTILGGYKLYDSSCSNLHQADYFETHLEQLLEAGVGEIMLGAIDKEGTLSGPDLVLINKVSKKIGVPLISNGGISSKEDIKNSVQAGSSAVAAGDFFVFNVIK